LETVVLKKGAFSEQWAAYLNTDLAKEKVFGIYGHPDGDECVLINDVDIAKRILIKDFDHFVDRTTFGLKFDENVEGDKIFSQMFMFSKGDDWKSGRSMMSPVFTTGKLKLMFPLLERVSQNMERYLLDCSEKNEEIDAKETFAKFSLDAIATSAFGIDLDTFKDPDNVFAKMVKELQRAKGSESGTPFQLLILILSLNFPILGKIFTIEQFSVKGTSFLKNALLKTVEMRKNGGKRRNDIIDHVLDLEKNNPDAMKNVSEDQFDKDAEIDVSNLKASSMNFDEILVSNAFLLFVAALDTTSSTLTFVMHFLLKYPELQEKIRDEISEVVGSSEKVTFEHIQEMKYMEKFILETLRRAHPFGNIFERECTKDYQIPGTNYVVRKGEIINFSLLYERMKTENDSFYNPLEFDPENFNPSNNPDNFSALAFGQGPRNCVGKRYAMLTMKLALVHILRNSRVTKTSNTKEELQMWKFIAGADVPFHVSKV